ncbi:MAG: DUF4209 domain-containing protein [Candidatus Saccharimonadales bacterium]
MDATERDARLGSLLAELETVKGVWEFDLASRIYALVGEDEAFQSDLAWQAEVLAFRFREASRIQDEENGSHYLPVTGGDVGQVSSAMVDYWVGRASETMNPLLKARYAGLAWEFGKTKLRMPIDHKVAITQIEALLEISKSDLHDEHINTIDKLLLALEVACSLNAKDLIEKTKLALLEYEARIGEDKYPGLWGFSFDALIRNKKAALSEEERAKLIADLEGRFGRLILPNDSGIPDHWGAEHAASRLADYYRSTGDLVNMKRVVRSLGAAWGAASSQAEPQLASAWLEHMHSVYESYGLQEEADHLLKQLRLLAPRVLESMKKIEQRVEIPPEEYEALLQRMVEGGLEKSLLRLTVRFYPKQKAVKEFLEKASAAAPLSSLLTKQLIATDGHVTAVIGPAQDDIDGNIVDGVCRLLQFEAPFLAHVMMKLQETYNLNSASIVGHLLKSPTFRVEREEFLKKGLDAYFSDDYMNCIHVLVPQIEEAVRHLLEKCGGAVLKSNRSGGYDLRTLDDLLRDKDIIKALGEDIAIYLRILLTDRRGWNMRNTICHGMLSIEEVGRPIADRLIHSLMCLALVREEQHKVSLVSKMPDQCTAGELTTFKQLVEKGEEVQQEGLQERIKNAAKLVILYIDDSARGVAALKIPNAGYRDSVFEKAGLKKDAHRFAHELGWVFLEEIARGKHHSSSLVQDALGGTEVLPIYATTSETNKPMQKTLERFGFKRSGNPYSGHQDRNLLLYVREPQK